MHRSVTIGAAFFALLACATRGESSAPQVQNGAKFYEEACAECHGPSLAGGKGPALRGSDFLQKWQHKPALELYNRILSTMPATEPGSLPEDQVLDITIFILHENRVDVGSQEMSTDRLGQIEIKPPTSAK